MSTVAEIKEAVARLPERQKIQIARWMQTQLPDRPGGQATGETATEGVPAETGQEVESALLHALQSPLKKYKPGHFAALASRTVRRKHRV